MFGHEGREKPEDDLAENIYRLPFGACIVLHDWWMLDLPFNPTVNAAIYTVTLTAGTSFF